METFRNVTADVLYTYEDGRPAVLSNQYGAGRAVISGVNLGLSYSARTLVGDDFTSSDEGNASFAAKKIIMRIMNECGIKKNPCSAEGVKVSVMKTEGEADGVILINSLHAAGKGEVELDRAYAGAEVVLGSAKAGMKNGRLQFEINADESAMIRLTK
jgi:hypothetical protein